MLCYLKKKIDVIFNTESEREGNERGKILRDRIDVRTITIVEKSGKKIIHNEFKKKNRK